MENWYLLVLLSNNAGQDLFCSWYPQSMSNSPCYGMYQYSSKITAKKITVC